MMSDAPAHHLFCLLGPVDVNMKSLPEVLCVIQVIILIKTKKYTTYNNFLLYLGMFRR